MGKKKKKKNRISNSSKYLAKMDQKIDDQYDLLMAQLKDMQERINLADEKAEKKIKKRLRNEMGVVPYYLHPDRVKAREKVIQHMEKIDMLSTLESVLNNVAPIIVMIAKLVINLIICIFSVDPVRRLCKPETIAKLEHIYAIAKNIS